MRRIRKKCFLIAVVCFFCAISLHTESIKVLYPNGGEILKPNTMVRIKWYSSTSEGKVVLILYKNGIKHSVISKGTDNNGYFLWKIPQNVPEGNDYRIRIRLLDNLSINDFSDRDFTIEKSN